MAGKNYFARASLLPCIITAANAIAQTMIRCCCDVAQPFTRAFFSTTPRLSDDGLTTWRCVVASSDRTLTLALLATVPHLALDLVRRFAARESLPNRMGTPDAPIAVVLPSDHGWTVPPYWATSTDDVYWGFARLSRPVGMRGVDGVFGAAFPGAGFSSQPYPFGSFDSDTDRSPALGFVPPQWTPNPDDVFYTKRPLPFGRFHTRDDAKAFMSEGGGGVRPVDTSPYRPMADTRWGAIIDALTDDADGDALAMYKVLVLVGPVNVTSSLEARLVAFARGGGTVVWSVGVATPFHMPLTGLNLTSELRAARALRWVGHVNNGGAGVGGVRASGCRTQATGGDIVHEPFLYVKPPPLIPTSFLTAPFTFFFIPDGTD